MWPQVVVQPSAPPCVASGYRFAEISWRGAGSAVWRAYRKDDEAGQDPVSIKVSAIQDARPRRGSVLPRPAQVRLPPHANIVCLLAHFCDAPPSSSQGCAGLAPCSSTCAFAVLGHADFSLEALAAGRCRRAATPAEGSEEALPPFEDAELFVVLQQASRALQHLQEHKIVHRNVTPGSLLVKGRLDGCDSGQVKLSDFEQHWDAGRFAAFGLGVQGSGFVMKAADARKETNEGHQPPSAALAPEVRDALPGGTDVDYEMNDMWALGHTLYEIARWDVRGEPYPGYVDDVQKCHRSLYQELPAQWYGRSLRAMVRGLLEPMPHWRPGPAAALEQATESAAEIGTIGHLVSLLDIGDGAHGGSGAGLAHRRAAEAAAALARLVEPLGGAGSAARSRQAVAEAGGVAALFALLAGRGVAGAGASETRVAAAGALAGLAASGMCQAALVDAGAIPVLVSIVKERGAPLKEKSSVANVLRLFAGAGNEQWTDAIMEVGGRQALQLLLVECSNEGTCAERARATLDLLPPSTPRRDELGPSHGCLGPLLHRPDEWPAPL